jgi:hypothetical protein
MATARKRLAVALGLLLLPFGLQAQDLWPGMEPYLAIRTVPTPTDVRAPVVTNLYPSALVAFSVNYRCDGAHSKGHGSYADAAMIYTAPIRTGESDGIPSPGSGCQGGIVTALWADGKEMGDPNELRNMHDCRAVALEELKKTLHEDILAVPQEKWDPAVSVANLKARRAQFAGNTHFEDPHDIRTFNCRAEEITYLITSVEQFRSGMANDPVKFGRLKGFYLQYLREWEQALASPTYPEKPVWWMNY